MSTKKLNNWWSMIDLNGLLRMFHKSKGQDANEFIDDCDLYWNSCSKREKMEIFRKYS